MPAQTGQLRDKSWSIRDEGRHQLSINPDRLLIGQAGLGAVALRLRRRKKIAIYTRYSTKGQRSTADQIRFCREWAAAAGLDCDLIVVFSDEGRSGRLCNRKALSDLQKAVEAGEIDTVIFFATHRLYRKAYKAMQFVNETLIENDVRVIFASQNIDSLDTESFHLQMQIYALIDELSNRLGHRSVKIAHIGMAMRSERYGARTFGYAGQDVPGKFTKTGKPVQINVICPIESVWVKRIFSWFVNDRLSCMDICRKLNTDPMAPKPVHGRWFTERAIKNLITNMRYVGDWSYGRSQNDWKAKNNGPVKKILEKPQSVIMQPQLRLIDDAMFGAAQARLASMPRAGKPPKGDGRKRPQHPLVGLLKCPRGHNVRRNAGMFWCLQCYKERRRSEIERALYTGVHPRTALAAVCRELARAIQSNVGAVKAIAEQAIHAAETAFAADDLPIRRLQKQIDELTASIKFIKKNPGESEVDQAENATLLREQQAERASLLAQMDSLQSLRDDPKRLPTPAEINRIAANMVKVLGNAAADESDDDVRRSLTVILHHLIAGHIELTQEGEAKHNRGWLRAHFTVDLGRLDPTRVIPGVEPVRLKVDLTAVDEDARDAEIIRLYDTTPMAMKKIAKKLGTSFETVRRVVVDHLSKKGLTIADSIRRPFMPRSVLKGKTKHLVRTPEVMRLYEQDRLLQEIVDETGLEIHMVKLLIKLWHEERGLPVPDCRSRRKRLMRKNRPKDRR